MTATLTVHCPGCGAKPQAPCLDHAGEIVRVHHARELIADGVAKMIRDGRAEPGTPTATLENAPSVKAAAAAETYVETQSGERHYPWGQTLTLVMEVTEDPERAALVIGDHRNALKWVTFLLQKEQARVAELEKEVEGLPATIAAAEKRADAASDAADAVYHAALGSAANPIAMADAIRIESLRGAAMDAFTLVRRAEIAGRKTVRVADVIAEFEKHANPGQEG